MYQIFKLGLHSCVLKNFVAIFTGKHAFWSPFLIMLQAFRPVTLLEIDSNTVAFL